MHKKALNLFLLTIFIYLVLGVSLMTYVMSNNIIKNDILNLSLFGVFAIVGGHFILSAAKRVRK